MSMGYGNYGYSSSAARQAQLEEYKLQQMRNNQQTTTTTTTTTTQPNYYQTPAVPYDYFAAQQALMNEQNKDNSEDDGKISPLKAVGNAIEGVGKSVVNGVKGMFFDENGDFSIGNTLKTAAMTAACFIPVVGPAIGCGLAGIGVYSGVNGVINAAQAAKNASTDAEAEAAWENIGGGIFTTALSAIGVKASAGILKGQLAGGSQMVQAIKLGAKAPKGAVFKGLKADFASNASAAWNGVKQTCKKGANLVQDLIDKPGATLAAGGKAIQNKLSNTWKKVTGAPKTVSDKIANMKKGYIDKEYATANIADDMAKLKIDKNGAKINGQAVTKAADGTYTYKNSGMTYKYNKKGRLESVTVSRGNNSYTYSSNGKLQSVSYNDINGNAVVDQYSAFGRRKARETKLPGDITETTTYSKYNPDNTQTSITRNGVTVNTRSDGSIYTTTGKKFGAKKLNYTYSDCDLSTSYSARRANGLFGKTTYTIDGVEATTLAQRNLARVGRGFSWLNNQKPLIVGGPTFGQLTTIKPNSFLANQNVQQMILAGEMILD